MLPCTEVQRVRLRGSMGTRDLAFYRPATVNPLVTVLGCHSSLLATVSPTPKFNTSKSALLLCP